MSNPTPELKSATEMVIAHIRRLMRGREAPILVALDGGSGSGKSTLASLIAEATGAALVQSDDFFAAEITDAEWDARTPEMRAAEVIDWRRLRAEALEPLRAAKSARWHAFDFQAGVREDGTYAMGTDFVELEPEPVIALDGAYSCQPELADLIDLSILIDAPVLVRHQRFAARAQAYHGLVEAKKYLDAWHARWDVAEEYYFAHVRPPTSFDLVVAN